MRQASAAPRPTCAVPRVPRLSGIRSCDSRPSTDPIRPLPPTNCGCAGSRNCTDAGSSNPLPIRWRMPCFSRLDSLRLVNGRLESVQCPQIAQSLRTGRHQPIIRALRLASHNIRACSLASCRMASSVGSRSLRSLCALTRRTARLLSSSKCFMRACCRSYNAVHSHGCFRPPILTVSSWLGRVGLGLQPDPSCRQVQKTQEAEAFEARRLAWYRQWHRAGRATGTMHNTSAWQSGRARYRERYACPLLTHPNSHLLASKDEAQCAFFHNACLFHGIHLSCWTGRPCSLQPYIFATAPARYVQVAVSIYDAYTGLHSFCTFSLRRTDSHKGGLWPIPC